MDVELGLTSSCIATAAPDSVLSAVPDTVTITACVPSTTAAVASALVTGRSPCVTAAAVVTPTWNNNNNNNNNHPPPKQQCRFVRTEVNPFQPCTNDRIRCRLPPMLLLVSNYCSTSRFIKTHTGCSGTTSPEEREEWESIWQRTNEFITHDTNLRELARESRRFELLSLVWLVYSVLFMILYSSSVEIPIIGVWILLLGTSVLIIRTSVLCSCNVVMLVSLTGVLWMIMHWSKETDEIIIWPWLLIAVLVGVMCKLKLASCRNRYFVYLNRHDTALLTVLYDIKSINNDLLYFTLHPKVAFHNFNIAVDVYKTTNDNNSNNNNNRNTTTDRSSFQRPTSLLTSSMLSRLLLGGAVTKRRSGGASAAADDVLTDQQQQPRELASLLLPDHNNTTI